MFSFKTAFRGALVLVVLLSALVFFFSNSYADSWTFGPASVSGNLTPGQTLTVAASFKAPSNAGANYLLDTEVYNSAGAKVAQWYDIAWLNAGQSVKRSYSWSTGGLSNGTYQFRQGVFSPNWSKSFGWNSQTGSATLGAILNVSPASWKSSASLKAAPATAGGANTVVASFTAANSGNYILDMELYDNAGHRLNQWFENRSMVAGQTQALNANFTAQTGTFVIKTGLFNPAWQLQSWNETALNFQVAAVINPQTPAASGFMRGVNLAGADFGDGNVPGVYGVDYTYPTASELDYYKNKGLNLIRLPFRWERVQHNLWGGLDGAELGRIDGVVAAAKARNMKVILDVHNYMRFRLNGSLYLIGSGQVPTAAFADFWTKLAARYNGETTIYAFSLMNEPHDTNGTWGPVAQAGLNAIRQSDRGHLVLVPGDGWSGAWKWQQFNAGLILNDPSNNLMYEAHQYFDRDSSGTYAESYDGSGAYPSIGVDRVQPFVSWLKAHNLRGIVTEYGVPNNDPRWQTVLDNFLTKLDSEGIGGTYWAGGPWWNWKTYGISSEPFNGQDAPVMSVISRHPGR